MHERTSRPAIISAPSIAVLMDFIVDSIFTIMPARSPVEGAVPTPVIKSEPSSEYSPMTARMLLVPISSPVIISLTNPSESVSQECNLYDTAP